MTNDKIRMTKEIRNPKSEGTAVSPKHSSRRSLLFGLLTVLLFAAGGGLTVAGNDKAIPSDDAAAKTRREESLRQMREMAASIKVTNDIENTKAEARLLPQAVLRYDDQPRTILDATLWCFGEKGRPAAMCKIEKYPDQEQGGHRWLYCFASLSAARVGAKWGAGREFSATQPGLTFFDLKEAPVPADTKPVRSRQVKELARRIAVSIADPDQGFKENMRLLTQPIHTYNQAAAGIVDGAVFVFSTNGTNPDVLVLIEAQREDQGQAKWRFAVVRMTNGELSVRDGEGKAWTAPFIGFADNLGVNLDTWTFFYAKP
jgi:hypothetical protein